MILDALRNNPKWIFKILSLAQTFISACKRVHRQANKKMSTLKRNPLPPPLERTSNDIPEPTPFIPLVPLCIFHALVASITRVASTGTVPIAISHVLSLCVTTDDFVPLSAISPFVLPLQQEMENDRADETDGDEHEGYTVAEGVPGCIAGSVLYI